MLANCVEDKNPGNEIRKTPLHWAAENGNLAICIFIVTNVDEKNPKDIYKNTPLHYAATSGNLEVSTTQ